jgi:predicted PurR-regulated permease PerM
MGVIVTAVQFQAFGMVFKVILLFFIIQQIDNNFIQPVFVGRNVNLSPVAIIFALVAGAEIFGIMGMIFAVPVLALMKNLFLIFIKRYKRAGNYGKSC